MADILDKIDFQQSPIDYPITTGTYILPFNYLKDEFKFSEKF
jgi:hypothetical protein